MSPLEQNIINLLPTLSDEAKSVARLVLGDSPSFTHKKKKEILSKQEAVLLARKMLKI